MNKTISKPRASRKENGPLVGNILKLLISGSVLVA